MTRRVHLNWKGANIRRANQPVAQNGTDALRRGLAGDLAILIRRQLRRTSLVTPAAAGTGATGLPAESNKTREILEDVQRD